MQEPIKFVGYLRDNERIYPVYSQNKIDILGEIPTLQFEKRYIPQITKELRKLGYTGSGTYTNGKLTVGDISPQNLGYDKNGNLKFIDADIYKKGGSL